MAQTGGGMPDEGDVSVPSVARVYDYALGGKDNRAADRAAVHEAELVAPSIRPLVINNRRFLQRAVRVLAEEHGVRQFIDHGSGLPTEDNVHQVAQRVDPAARVVYVDHDPLVLAHGRDRLAANEHTALVQADFLDTDGVFGHPEVARLIDLSEPVAALFVSVLHGIPDSADPGGLVRRVMDRLPSGSFLVISHLVGEDDQLRRDMTDFVLKRMAGRWGRVRREQEVGGYFGGLEVLGPGLVEVSTWRPDSQFGPRQLTREWIEYGGVARKP